MEVESETRDMWGLGYLRKVLTPHEVIFGSLIFGGDIWGQLGPRDVVLTNKIIALIKCTQRAPSLSLCW